MVIRPPSRFQCNKPILWFLIQQFYVILQPNYNDYGWFSRFNCYPWLQDLYEENAFLFRDNNNYWTCLSMASLGRSRHDDYLRWRSLRHMAHLLHHRENHIQPRQLNTYVSSTDSRRNHSLVFAPNIHKITAPPATALCRGEHLRK